MKIWIWIALLILSLGFWVAATLLWGLIGPSELVAIVTIGGLLLLPLAMVLKRLSAIVWIVIAFLILLSGFLSSVTLVRIFPNQQGDPFGTSLAFTQLVVFSLALAVAALLIHSGLRPYTTQQDADPNTNPEDDQVPGIQTKNTGRGAAAVLALGLLLLVTALYRFYWFMIWDNTYDALGYLWLPVPVLTALSGTFMLALMLPKKTKFASFLYFLLIPAMIAITYSAQRVNFHQLTDERAERLGQAIERYYTQKDHYPENLQALTPRFLIAIPSPVIIYGQEWCYESGEGYYRLGYIDREHWSAPHLIGRVYKAQGEIPDIHGMCEPQAVALQKRHPDFPFEYWVEGD